MLSSVKKRQESKQRGGQGLDEWKSCQSTNQVYQNQQYAAQCTLSQGTYSSQKARQQMEEAQYLMQQNNFKHRKSS